MDLKESMLFNAGSLTNEEYLLKEERNLMEGIKRFKVSKKLEKAIDGIQNRMKKAEGDQKKALQSFLKELKTARDEFEDLERRYEDAGDAEKSDLKKQYSQAKKKYSSLIKKANSSNVRKALIGVGAVGLVLGSLTALYAALGGQVPQDVESVREKMMRGAHSPMGADERKLGGLFDKLQKGLGKLSAPSTEGLKGGNVPGVGKGGSVM
jgi:hypothetical protein